MRALSKRVAALLAVAGLIPSAGLAQPEKPICREQGQLSQNVLTITELVEESLGLINYHRVILLPTNITPSNTDVTTHENGPRLVFYMDERRSDLVGGEAYLLDLKASIETRAILEINHQEIPGELVPIERNLDYHWEVKFYADTFFEYNTFALPFRNLSLRLEDPNKIVKIEYDGPTAYTAITTFADSQRNLVVKSYNDGLCTPIEGDCFLTTATCDVIGLTDDCWELRTLRRFRDAWLSRQPGGKADIDRYYREAPAIAQRLRADPSEAVREYWRFVLPSAIAVSLGANRLARSIYSRGMMRLARASETSDLAG